MGQRGVVKPVRSLTELTAWNAAVPFGVVAIMHFLNALTLREFGLVVLALIVMIILSFIDGVRIGTHWRKDRV